MGNWQNRWLDDPWLVALVGGRVRIDGWMTHG